MLSLVNIASGIEQGHSSASCRWINAKVLSYFPVQLALNFHLVYHAPSEIIGVRYSPVRLARHRACIYSSTFALD